MKNNFFIKTICGLLLLALLVFNMGNATTVFALADPVQSIAPVYDTQIYQLQDYIENGGLTSGQLDIFYTLAGFYVLGQAGSSGYRLVDPYANSDSVWDWLKSCGIEIYNTVIGLVPDTARMPITGDIYSTIPFKKASQLYVATLMGAAVKAATFSSYQDFKDEVINSQSYWLPWNLDVQKGMNSIFGIYNGIYQWQFDSNPWVSNFTWLTANMSASNQLTYDNYCNALTQPTIKTNHTYGSGYNMVFSNVGKFDLFVNTSTSKAYFVDSSGSLHSTISTNGVYYRSDNSRVIRTVVRLYFNQYDYSSLTFNNINDLVNQILSLNTTSVLNVFYEDGGYGSYPLLSDLFDHVYVGTNWLNKSEIFNITDLNFDESDQQYYKTVPDTNEYLIDIKGILQDILNNTDLFNIFLNNLVDINGVPVHDDDLISITTSIYDLLEQTNPVLPVNLNDISDYTDNSYLEVVKQRATAAGSTLANLVAFWHNCDPEIIYAIFGSGIMVLIGAFIGKWGHS